MESLLEDVGRRVVERFFINHGLRFTQSWGRLLPGNRGDTVLESKDTKATVIYYNWDC